MIYLKQLICSLSLILLVSCNSLSFDEQEYYEYRIYKIDSSDNQHQVLKYLRMAYVPAMHRMGLTRIGVFVNAKKLDDYDIHMILPFNGMGQYLGRSEYLESDVSFQEDAAVFFGSAKNNPPYTRIESSFFKAFSSIPFIEMPEESLKDKKRIFELRVYESHNDKMAALKRDMFNIDGETQLMRDLGMGPVFFGECLSGKNYPNLTYMLSASSLEDNKAYWQKFLQSPRWAEMKKIEKYKGTVSKIEKKFLKPVDFSDL